MTADTLARKHIRALIKVIDDLTENSVGVAGLHKNGDIAPWSDLLSGGRYSAWAGEDMDAAQAFLDTPIPAVQSVEGGDEEQLTGADYLEAAARIAEGADGVINQMTMRSPTGHDIAKIIRELTPDNLTSQLTKQAEEMAGMRRAVLEEACAVVEAYADEQSKTVMTMPVIRAIRSLIEPKVGEG